MRRFETSKGESLGTLFCGDNGRTLMQTETEEKLMWSLSETDLCMEDEWREWSLKDLMDLFLNDSTRCTKEEFLRRGWKESRWTEGLSFQSGFSNDGRSFLMR